MKIQNEDLNILKREYMRSRPASRLIRPFHLKAMYYSLSFCHKYDALEGKTY